MLQFWGTYRWFSKDGPIPDRLWQRFSYPDRESYPPTNRDEERFDGQNSDVENHIDYPEKGIYSRTSEEDLVS